jgi:membrane protein
MRLSASLAYYAIFSMVPLLVIGMAIAALVFGETAARGQTAEQLRVLAGTDTANAILSFLQGASQRASNYTATFVGVVILLFGASGVFTELKDALNTIWGVAIKPGRTLRTMLRERVIVFTMVFAVGVLLMGSLAVSAIIAMLGEFAPGMPPWPPSILQITDNIVSFLVATGLFALLFKLVPNVEMRWRDVAVGAAVTGFLFTIGKFLIGFYLGTTAVASYYGAAGSATVLLIWVYYSACILFYGAEFTKAWVVKFGSGVVPDGHAIFRTGSPRKEVGKSA